MARGGGIEIPITVDASDLPRARKQIEAFLKGVSKQAGKYSVIDVFSGGAKVGAAGTTKGIKAMQEYWDHFATGAKKIKDMEMRLKELTLEIKRGEEATKHYQKAIKNLATGKQIAGGLQTQIGHFYGPRGLKTLNEMIARYNLLGVEIKNAGLSAAKLKEHQAERKNLAKEIEKRLAKQVKSVRTLKEDHKGLTGLIAKERELYKDTLTYKVRDLTISQQRTRWVAEAKREIGKQKKEYERLYWLQKQGLATEQQKVQLVKLSNDLTLRGVKLKERETREWRKISREARKITERRGLFPGGSLLNIQRLGWFIQLRGYWAMYRVFGALTERLVDLDEATARAMRTTREAGVTYEDMSQRVENAIKRVAAATGATYRDVGEAMYQLTSAGLTAQEAFSGLSTVMKVAVLTETDVTAATKLVAGVYNNLKETLDDVSSSTAGMRQIGETLIYTWQNNQVELSELTAALNQSIQSGKQAGLTFDELSIVLGNLGTFMVRGGRGGRSLRNVFINLIRDAEKAKEIFHLTREELDISGPIDFIALFKKMSEQWKAMGKEANKFQQAMELVRRRAGEAFIAILEGWDRIEEQLDGVENAHISLEQEIVNLTSRYRTLGKVISAEVANWVDDLFNYMDVIKTLGHVFLLTIKAGRAEMIHRHPEKIVERYGRDPEAIKEAAQEFRAYMGLAKRAGYGEESLMMNDLRAAAEYLENMAQAIRENDELFESLDETASEAGKKVVLWAKGRSQMEKEWMVLLDKESRLYDRLAAARAQYERKWLAFTKLTRDTSTEIRGQVLKEAQKAHALVFRLEAQMDRYLLRRAQQIARQAREANRETFQALQKGMDLFVSEDLERKHENVLNRMQHQINLAQQQFSIEQKRGINAVKNLQLEYAIGKEGLKQDEAEIKQTLELIRARRMELELLEQNRHLYKDAPAAIQRVKDQIYALEISLRNQTQATALAYFQLQELNRQLVEMLSPMEQIRAGFRKLQVQWEDQANDFEGLTVRMGQSFENNLSGALADWVDGTKNAKDAFRDFAETFLREINRMIIQMIVAKALATALGFATGGGGGESAGMYQGQTPAGQGQIYISRAAGGILPHIRGFRRMSRGGVTGGPTVAFLGDNKSGRELVIPEENIRSDEASGYVRSGEQPINIVNLITQEDIANAMAQDSGERVIINTIGKDIAAKKSTFRQVQEAARKRG